MSVSCVGTCSNCGTRRFWISDTLSLQLDDGRLKCLPHPAERWACEELGLTLGQASERGRLYRETFYVCRNCGREGKTIRKHAAKDPDPYTSSVRSAMKWGWGAAVIVVPLFTWMRWWETAAVVGGALLASPAICWWESRKRAKASPAPALPRSDAPGQFPITEPLLGSNDHMALLLRTADNGGKPCPTGRCCNNPDWIEAFGVKDDDHVPCRACGNGVMLVSEQSVH